MNICPVTVTTRTTTNLGYIEDHGHCQGGEDVGEDPQLGAVAHLQGPVQYWSGIAMNSVFHFFLSVTFLQSDVKIIYWKAVITSTCGQTVKLNILATDELW